MNGQPIFMYHSVDVAPTDPLLIQVTPNRLRAQLKMLRQFRLRGVSMRELLAAGGDSRLVGLTFDDGYADFLSCAMPVLAEFDCTATVFIVAGRLGGSSAWDPPPHRPLMTADQLRMVHAAGHEIGSHGLRHVRLDELEPEALVEEVAQSRTLLERTIEAPVAGFCYPYGAAGTAAVTMVRRHYDYACTVAAGPAIDQWTLPRSYVGQADNTLRLGVKLAARPLRERMQCRLTRVEGSTPPHQAAHSATEPTLLLPVGEEEHKMPTPVEAVEARDGVVL